MTLTGRRILVPRGGEMGERWASAIRERGGDPVVAPLTESAPPEDSRALAAAAERWNRGAYDWMVVTSANGAHAIADAGARPGTGHVAAVGPATAEALLERGFSVALQPEHDFSARGVGEALLARIGVVSTDTATGAARGTEMGAARGAVVGTAMSPATGVETGDAEGRADLLSGPETSTGYALHLLLPLSEIASTELETALVGAGHVPDRVTAYRTLPTLRDAALESEVAEGGIDVILVLSGSGAAEVARRFALLPAGAPADGAASSGALLAAIGAPTARALAAHGLRADIVADRHTLDGLLDALSEAFADPATAAPAPVTPSTATPDSAASDPAASDSGTRSPAIPDFTGIDPASSGGSSV